MIKFSEDAKEAFENKGLQAKKIILSALGSNLLLKDKNLAIDVQNALLPMQLISSGTKTKTGKFEPVKIGIDKQKSGALGSANPVWLPLVDAFGTFDWKNTLLQIRFVDYKIG